MISTLPITLNPAANGFDLGNARCCAAFAELAYNESDLRDPKTNASCIVRELDNCIVIAFKGSKQIADWIADAEFWLCDEGQVSGEEDSRHPSPATRHIQVHHGFLADIDSLMPAIIADLNGRPFAKPLFITGHSLGGALAQLCAFMLCCHDEKEFNASTLRVTDALGAAIKGGLITEAEKPVWEGRLKVEAQFANELTALRALTPKVKTTSVTVNRGGREEQIDVSNPADRARFVNTAIAEIAAEMKLDVKKDYNQLFTEVGRRHPTLFANMTQPELNGKAKAKNN